jgi:hypothetical protein
MPTNTRRLAGALLATTILVTGLMSGSAAAAHPGGGHHDGHGSHGGAVKLVVNTQFEAGTSPVVKATGAFRKCTSVQDLYGDAVDLGYTLAFYGIKEVTCARGDVILSYGVILSTHREGVTYGSWNILVSTLPGVESGGGKLYGDPSKCVDLTGDEGCILDTFRGRVR